MSDNDPQWNHAGPEFIPLNTELVDHSNLHKEMTLDEYETLVENLNDEIVYLTESNLNLKDELASLYSLLGVINKQIGAVIPKQKECAIPMVELIKPCVKRR